MQAKPLQLRTLTIALFAGTATLLAGCASTGSGDGTANNAPAAIAPAQLPAAVNRVSWGVNQGTWQQAQTLGYEAWLERQLHPAPAPLPVLAQPASRVAVPAKSAIVKVRS